MSTGLDWAKLQEGLQTKVLGRTIFLSKEVGSTNEWAKELANLGASEGTIAFAETQTHGRGRINRKWISPRSGLWFSVLLRPKFSPKDATKLTFVASLAVAEVLHDLYGLRAETKWPNDVIVNERKICGILSEMSTSGQKVSFVVVGIGVNVNFNVESFFPASIRSIATSVEDELGRRVPLEQLFRTLLEKLETIYDLYTGKGFSPVLKEWKRYAGFLGHEVEVSDQNGKIRGLACDVDQEGALILRIENGTLKHVFAGDVSLRTK
jgi:BirA family biotin operon repressor/biotin-[acetyl-CoA-carboxylase] ligase